MSFKLNKPLINTALLAALITAFIPSKTFACGGDAYCARCVRLGAHMALGVLGADRQGVAWRRGKAGDPLVPSVRVFCGG